MRRDRGWARRFTAPATGFPRWDPRRPDRLAAVSNEGGSWQAWTFDTGGTRRAATAEKIGVEEILVAPDGRLVWWHDPTGNEHGHWLAAPFDGEDPEPLVRGVPDGWAMGLGMAGDVVAIGLATDDDYRIYVARAGEPARELWRSKHVAGVGREWPNGLAGLSADGRLVSVWHAEGGDILHLALRVFAVSTGVVVGDLRDEGRRLDGVAWSPVPGDERLLVDREPGELERPSIWDPRAGTVQSLEPDLPGGVYAVDWWPDAEAVLVRHEHEGVDSLYRIEPATGRTTIVTEASGEITDAAVRPDGRVWYLVGDSVHPARTLESGGGEVLEVPGPKPPAGRKYRSLWFSSPGQERIQAFVAEPEGPGPFPIVMSVHGGPEWHERDRFDPETQAFVDEGYAVALVNYRGSTGYGIPFREAIHGNIGFPESEDIVACLDRLVADGVADPAQAFIAGWSWGGYLACLNAGLNPDRWRAVFAGIPTGDYLGAHYASAPAIQAWDNAVMGGTPEELPDLYRERDPMTYVDKVTAPVLVIAGEHDSRCPMEGVQPWVDRLIERGIEVELVTYPAGHHENEIAEQVRQMATILAFFDRHRR